MKGSRASLALVLLVWASGSPAAAQSPAPGSRPPPPPVSAPTAVGREGPVPAAAATAGPPYKLDVQGDANITGTYRVNGVPISATSNWTQAGNTINYTTGNVGIGTPTPAHALQVNGTTLLGAPGGVYGFSLSGPSGPYPTLGFNAFYNGSGSYLAGVGGYGGVFQFQDGDGLFGYYNTSASVAAGAPHTFTPRFTIDKDGIVGIGTTPDANTRLRVDGGAAGGVWGSSTGYRGVEGSSTSGDGVVGRSSTRDGVVGTSGSGYGVFGDSYSSYGVYGKSYTSYGVHGYSATSWAGYFTGSVNVTGVVCATNVGCGSDARLKQDVTPLSYGLREVLRLRPVRWQWKDTTTTQLTLGLVAQDVEPVLPELILRNVDTHGSLGLNYFGFVPVLINAIQEQQDTITALKDTITALNAENTSLDTRIRALEQAWQRSREPR